MSAPPTSLAPLVFVYAVARGGVIGRGGKLPWDIPEDRAHFDALTRGHAVVMGRKTWDETGAPLPERRTIVISRSPALVLPGAEVALSVEAALALARESDAAPCVVGGAAIFRAALPLATRIERTEIDRTVEGDTVLDLDLVDFDETARRLGRDRTLSFVTLARR